MKVSKQAPKLLSEPLSKGQKIGFIMSPRLGDSLLSMVVTHNLQKNGFDVTVFSNNLISLASWYANYKVQPVPDDKNSEAIFKQYDILLHAYHCDIVGNTADWHQGICVLDGSPLYRSRIPMPDIQALVCREELNLIDVVRTSPLTIPKELKHRQHNRRIVIHPTSGQTFRNWLPQRFLKLAEILKQKGYQPEFIVDAEERPEWEWVMAAGFALPQFASLDAVARWVYESGWFIGNDSGIGHLASNLGIPTMTLGIRPSLLRRWRPSWSPGRVLLPTPLLITRPLKEKFWKYFISVRRAVREFEKLAAS